ncbi:hypothetical protein BU25DRAFT_138256 [Macroventuria anomochaeta]|uniref:Uncharacterized protein n=1 Tax=Macroventuria anomochaeta TaxID=301207 RepID=A0ACB6SD26_9PLEO|nr:uncharacterized protein BU25DRAFT_138256 [Macroventuria anomochaeta]KAF2632051.1 hypothetical protein BU25DRAFT_138256 [Macroventuria anomochaeta]
MLSRNCSIRRLLGGNTPVMRELVHGLAEVYCLSDATQAGNPIVFASEVLQHYSTWKWICDRKSLSLSSGAGDRQACHCKDGQGFSGAKRGR